MVLYSWLCLFFCISVPLVHPRFVTARSSKVLRKEERIWGVSGTDLDHIFHFPWHLCVTISLSGLCNDVHSLVTARGYWGSKFTFLQPLVLGRQWSPARKSSVSSPEREVLGERSRALGSQKAAVLRAEKGAAGRWGAVTSICALFWATHSPELRLPYLRVCDKVTAHPQGHSFATAGRQRVSFQNLDLGKFPFPFPVEESI